MVTCPGLLDSDKVFANFTTRLAKTEHCGRLGTLV
jgi:hypothetical protein